MYVHKPKDTDKHEHFIKYLVYVLTVTMQSCETTTNEIVFGAVHESDTKRRAVEIKAVNYGDPMYEQYSVRYRNRYISYGNY
ncbi:hypothetical protein BHE74_00035751 [Ensete ventricosum]|nr:hypothetical protein GW17_00044312 [Ensete ventricosum]RWW57464.1 hypothetical protein BHE74_00035751 [Ensete ventricosum]